jgi:DNA-binding response OmpR family regulator
MLPGTSGLEICRALRADPRLRHVPIIILTARHETPLKVQGLDLGADDYVTKPFDFPELLARVRARLRARRTDPDELSVAGLRLVRARHEVNSAAGAAALSPREFDLLALLMRHPNQILFRSTIVDRVWGDLADIESNVLDVYIRRLRRKLDSIGFTGRIRTARGDGYVLESPTAAR